MVSLYDEFQRELQRQPRPLRDAQRLWGFLTMTVREHQQVILANRLMQVTLTFYSLLVLAGAVAVVEHPASPWWQPKCASIFKLDIVQALAAAPCSQLVTFHPGFHGRSIFRKCAWVARMLAMRGSLAGRRYTHIKRAGLLLRAL